MRAAETVVSSGAFVPDPEPGSGDGCCVSGDVSGRVCAFPGAIPFRRMRVSCPPRALRSPTSEVLAMKRMKSVSPKLGGRAVHPNAAGIDLGSREHWVALPPGRADPNIRSFGCYTAILKRWRLGCRNGIGHGRDGVDWGLQGAVYQVLERHSGTRSPGKRQAPEDRPRPTDGRSARSVAPHLHELWPVAGSFRPDDAICVIRSYIRQPRQPRGRVLASTS